MEETPVQPISRRRMIKGIGAGAAIAWSTPILTSVRATAFAASGGACKQAGQFCGPPDPRCGAPGVACSVPPGCQAGACTLMNDRSCFCWDFAVCTSPNPICSSDADCGANEKCGPVDPACNNLCAGNVACFHHCGSAGSAPRSGRGRVVARA